MHLNKKLLRQIVDKFDTQIAFSKVIGRHRVIVSDVVHGRRNLNIKEQQQWAKALGCSVESIF